MVRYQALPCPTVVRSFDNTHPVAAQTTPRIGIHAVAFADSSLVMLHANKLRVLTSGELGQTPKAKKASRDPITVLRWQNRVTESAC